MSPLRQDVSILGGLDDIQILLDDHLIKCQALRASPYMDAFADQFKVINHVSYSGH